MNAHEYESPSLPQVKGRLKLHIQFWIDIQAPDFILDCIRDGYKIPFFSMPEPAAFSNNRSAQTHAEFVADAITELLSLGRVHQTRKEQLLVISPLSVSVQQTGKKRLILDLRYVNQHVYKQRVKFDHWRTAINFFGKGTYFTKFDLKTGYHHLEIFPEHQPFLGFSWTYPDGNTCYYMFSVLPFGLSSAPYIFTKLLTDLPRCDRRLLVYQSLSSRAPSTVAKYLSEHRKFINFLTHSSWPTKLPSDSLHISLYLAYLSQTKHSYNVVLQAHCGIKWVHSLLPPTKTEILRTAPFQPTSSKQQKGFSKNPFGKSNQFLQEW